MLIPFLSANHALVLLTSYARTSTIFPTPPSALPTANFSYTATTSSNGRFDFAYGSTILRGNSKTLVSYGIANGDTVNVLIVNAHEAPGTEVEKSNGVEEEFPIWVYIVTGKVQVIC